MANGNQDPHYVQGKNIITMYMIPQVGAKINMTYGKHIDSKELVFKRDLIQSWVEIGWEVGTNQGKGWRRR